ncbi:MAG: riboflavin synthase [Candidatus Margulisbacteria bacterium]|jgi:riboflavin synthase|nr:riboflavin synthase [Candidatus Margulisiibacteriota bacterium]
MFTGIIEEIGQARAVGERLEIHAPQICQDVKLGDSVAVNGVCLTVADIKENSLFFDTMQLTLRDTALGNLKSGAAVNLERALRADSRLGGHFVSGHVDEAGLVEALDANILRVRVSDKKFLAPKGSITINGVSLTIQDVRDNAFSIGLVAHTLQSTTLGLLRTGDRVNIEYDLLMRYLQTLLAAENQPQRLRSMYKQ